MPIPSPVPGTCERPREGVRDEYIGGKEEAADVCSAARKLDAAAGGAVAGAGKVNHGD